MTRPRAYAQAIAVTAILSVPLGLAAQDESGGIGELRFGEKLLWQDDELKLRSDLGFFYSSQTRRQSFLIDMYGGVDITESDGLENGLQDPRLLLDYGLENRNSALDLALRYRRSDINSLVFDEDLIDPPEVLDDGTRTDASARLGLELGREAPFGAEMSLGYASGTYSDTTSPSLQDSEEVDGFLRLRFDITSRIRANTTYFMSDLDRDGGIDVRTETLSVGVAMIISPVLETQVDIGTTRVIQTGTVPRTVDEGPFLALGAIRALNNGALNGSLISDLDENGRRTTLEFARELELPAGFLSFGAGLSQGSGSSDLQPLLSFGYERDLPRGNFGIDLSQRFRTDSAGNEVLDSLLAMRVQQELTPRDRLSAAVRVRNSNQTGGVDTRFAGIGFDYSRDLTEDWAFVSAYEHTRRTQGTGGEDSDDTFFIGLSTALQWRP